MNSHSPRSLNHRKKIVLKQLNQLIDLAVKEKIKYNKTRRCNKCNKYNRHYANVPHKHSKTKSRSSSRRRRMGTVIDETIYVPAMPRSDSDEDIRPSGAHLARWEFRYGKKPQVYNELPKKEVTDADISALIRESQLRKNMK